MKNHEQKSPGESIHTIHTILDNVVQYHTTKLGTTVPNYTKLKNIHTKVSEDAFDTFKTHIIRKHGKLHSAMGKELTKAIIIYNELENIKLQHTTSSHTDSKWEVRADVAQKFERIRRRIYELHNYPEVHTKSIQEITREVLGQSDARTFNKYYKTVLQRCKIIKTGLYGSLVDVSTFVGYDKIDVSKLAPTEKDDENLV